MTSPDLAARRRILLALSVTVTASYGVLYYGFPVLVTEISADTGWTVTSLTGAFSLALLVSAGVGVPVGRRLDRHGPRWVMTLGSAVAVPALMMIALAPNLPTFVAGWVLAGGAMGATFYPPAFAAITRWHGAARVRALTLLTLAAGFASTIFAPLTAVLLDQVGWRSTYLLLGAFLGVVSVPAHWWGLRGDWPEVNSSRHSGDSATADPAHTARSLPFVALVAAMAIGTFAALAVVINLVPMLIERGVDTGTAAVILGLGGAGQVAGRMVYPAIARRTSVRTRTVLVLATVALTTALLGVLNTALAVTVAAVAAGIARGLKTLLLATAVTDRWGIEHYGRLNGVMNAPVTIAVALGPWAGAAMASWLGSYSAAFLVLAGCALTSVVLAVVSVPAVRTRDRAPRATADV